MSLISQFVLFLIMMATAVTCKVTGDTLSPPSSSVVEWISFRNVSSLDTLEPAGWVESTKTPYYIARTKFRGEWFPGYVHKGDHNIWLGYSGAQYNFQDYEFLMVTPKGGALSWVRYSNESLPRNAFSGGTKDPLTKEPYFMCRTKHIDTQWYGNKLLLPGKMKRRLGRCGIQLHGVEHFYDEFEVLVDNRLGGDVNVSSVANCASGAAWLRPAQASRDQVLLAGEILGYPVFIGRTQFQGYQIPGYVINEENTILIEVNKRPINQSNFELLGCAGNDLVWIQASASDDDDTGVVFDGGLDPESGVRYLCRTWYGEHTIPGRIQVSPSFACVFRFADQVFQNEDFEILVDTSRHVGFTAPVTTFSGFWIAGIVLIVVVVPLLLAITFIIYRLKPGTNRESPPQPHQESSSSWATTTLLVCDDETEHPM